jgi:hypothetical protein
MKRGHAIGHLGRLGSSVLCALALAATWVGGAAALPYDNTNPGSTPCGDGSHTIYTLGNRNSGSPTGDVGLPTPIKAGSLQVGTVQIRHSAYCGTVWAKVYNTSGVTTQIKEAIVTYSDSNGTGRSEHWKTCCDSVAHNGNNTSNQYRDRASFSARGGVLYNGTWYYAETSRAIAWAQQESNYALTPYACQHSFIWQCQRWPTTAGGGANGASIGLYYYKDFDLASMPTGNGGLLDMRADVDYMFNEFNVVPGGSPVFSPTAGNEDVSVVPYSLNNGTYAVTDVYPDGSTGLHTYVQIKITTNTSWMTTSTYWTHAQTREVMCHEIDHLMGMGHVNSHNSSNVDVIGSKATCIGNWYSSGPQIDDEQALAAIYSGVAP